jgi:hypothetical protein
MMTLGDVSAPRPPTRLSKVDLPEPEAPVIATNCPAGNGARISEARAQSVLASIKQAEQRFKDQKPRAEAEAAIRKLFSDIAAGKPDYESMNRDFADITRQQLVGMQGFVKGLGEMKSLVFQRVSEDGSDEYHADFANGTLKINIGFDGEGRIDGVRVQPR